MAITLDTLFDVPLRMIADLMPDPKTRISFDSTCKRFYSLSTNLYKATEALAQVISRLMPPDEAARRAFANIPWIEIELLEGYAGKTMDEFYSLFRQRMLQFNVPIFSKKCVAMLRLFKEKLLPVHFSSHVPAQAAIERKIKNAIMLGLQHRMAEEIRKVYGEQPIGNISCETFAELTELVYKQLQNYPGPRNEMSILLKRITLKHTPAQIDALRLEYLNPAPDAPRFIAVKERITRELTQEKEALEAQFKEMTQKQEAAEEAFRKAKDAMEQSFPSLVDRLMAGEQDGLLAELPLSQHDDFIRLSTELWERDAVFADIDQPWSPKGRAIEEKIQEIAPQLQPEAIDTAARTSMENNARFFEELMQAVSEV